MKTPNLPALLLVLSSICLSCDSTVDDAPIPCGDPSLRVSGLSFILNGIRYDHSALFPYGSGTIYTRSPSKVSLKFDWMGFGPDTFRNFFLEVSWPHYRTGNYSWRDRTLDSMGYGCTIYFDSTTSSTTYESISGTTSIFLIQGKDRDSIFGTFCGTMKNDRGEVVEITDGRFDAAL